MRVMPNATAGLNAPPEILPTANAPTRTVKPIANPLCTYSLLSPWEYHRPECPGPIYFIPSKAATDGAFSRDTKTLGQLQPRRRHEKLLPVLKRSHGSKFPGKELSSTVPERPVFIGILRN
jgi:hypothetical protein